MSVSYGFYNSINHDRRVNAAQMSAIFDGIINDGVFSSVGGCLLTRPGTGLSVIVASGRAWFDHTWTYNDSDLVLSLAAAEMTLARIDAIVLEVNSTTEIRANSIKVIKGTPASTPARPVLTDTDTVHQHALAYITVPAQATEIAAENIANIPGSTEQPFVTGALKTASIESLYQQWQESFNAWFQNVQYVLSGDAAGKLQVQVDTINSTFEKMDGVMNIAIITESTNWKAPSDLIGKLHVLIFGGGGGNSDFRGGGGGGGGHMKEADIDVTPGFTYPIVIGAGGGQNKNGGSSSFAELTANGGDCGIGFDGGSGGTGGGGGHHVQSGEGDMGVGKGGNGSYGGGGGAAAQRIATTDWPATNVGGSGGTYGGGGAGSNRAPGGQFGGNGGISSAPVADQYGLEGTPITPWGTRFSMYYYMLLSHLGESQNVQGAGAGGRSNDSSYGGGGGGGYGGAGGTGGGGGGGYGGNGGGYTTYEAGHGGGGGGGYGGSGLNGTRSNYYGGGGGGGGFFDIAARGGDGSTAGSPSSGQPGIVVIFYRTKEKEGVYAS